MAISETTIGSVQRQPFQRSVGTYLCVEAFFVVSCIRPQDWIPGLSAAPVAMVTGFVASIAFMLFLSQNSPSLPPELICLILLSAHLFVAALMSPVWPGGALLAALGFAKVVLIVVMIISVANTPKRFRRLIFIQAASVAAVAVFTVSKGHEIAGRLQGVAGGDYYNPNDLAVALAITLPLCLGLLFCSSSKLWRAVWLLAMLVMTYAIFLTESRQGFLALIGAAVVSLWEFAIRGTRRYLLAVVAFAAVVFWLSSGAALLPRLKGIVDPTQDAAYGSVQQREELIRRSIELTEEHPLFGVGPDNFQILSGNWHLTHNTFTEISSEGGIPAFALYMFILWVGFKNVRSIKRLAGGQTESGVLARCLHASLAAYVIGSLFASFGYHYLPYYVVAYTTILASLVKKSTSHSENRACISEVPPNVEGYFESSNPRMA